MIFRRLKEDVACLHSEMTNFGSSFKRARETKGISIDQIASETRISTRFLLAIENEQFHLLPGGIFNRGFIRAYAEKVGLDPNQAVADYERLGGSGETSEDPGTAISGPAKRDRRLYPVAIASLLLLIIIFYVITRESSNTANTAQLASPPPAPPSANAPDANSFTPTEVEAPPVVSELQPAPSTPVEALRIDIEVKETSWIKVSTDGKRVDAGEILQPGITRHYAAQNSIVLSMGNAGGLVLKINDMPAKELGNRGQVRELKITPENLRDFIR